MTPFFCRHRWPKWSAPRLVSGWIMIRDYRHETRFMLQSRTCSKCGKHEIREINP